VAHAHHRGTYPSSRFKSDGEQKTTSTPFYDFNWQRMYEFAEPISIPAGSKVIATYIYDNSANPANLNPNEKIVGDQSSRRCSTLAALSLTDETAAKQTAMTSCCQDRLMGMMTTTSTTSCRRRTARAVCPARRSLRWRRQQGWRHRPGRTEKVLAMMRRCCAAPARGAAPAPPGPRREGGQ
jgi:hypothetical protein